MLEREDAGLGVVATGHEVLSQVEEVLEVLALEG